jgi:hypothetical protein
MANFHPQRHSSMERTFNQSMEELGQILGTPSPPSTAQPEPNGAIVKDDWDEQLKAAAEDIEAFFQTKRQRLDSR